MTAVAQKWRVAFVPAPRDGLRPSPPSSDSKVEVWRDNRGNVCANGYEADGYGWMYLFGAGTFRFDPLSREVTAFALPGIAPDLVLEAYSHAALPMALHYFGREVLHASAVRTGGGVVGFCALSETGKSTTAAALSARGYPLWADDAVAIDCSESENSTRGGLSVNTPLLPFNPRLRPRSARYLGALENRIVRIESGGDFTSSPLAALCVLERRAEAVGDVEIRRLSPGEAFGALLPHAFCFSLEDQRRKRAMLQTYLRLSARIPTFAISFAPGFIRLPGILDTIESSIPGFVAQSSINESASTFV